MTGREIPGSGYDSGTRNKILDAATKAFALKGFGSVSMRDISKDVGIKMSSIYYYYESKDALMEDALSRFESGYRHYFDWLSSMNAKAESLEELMDNMFNREFLEMQNPIACLGMSLTLKQQHNNVSARKRVFDLFYEHSIKLMQADFDRLVEKDVIPPSDTKMIAAIFMFCVLVCNDMRVHEYTGAEPPVDCREIYGGLREFMTLALIRGRISADEHA